MPVKISIEADNIRMVQALLTGMTHAIREELEDPVVLSDQASSDIVQNGSIESWVDESPDVIEPEQAELELGASANLVTEVPAAVVAPKRRGRKPKLVADVEPPPEVITEEDEPEAEGAVDSPEPEPETTGVSEAQLREKVRAIMDEDGIPAALQLLGKGGYKHVKDIPASEYDRVYAILTKAKA